MFPGPFIIASGHQYCSSWPHTSKTKEDAWWTLSSGCRHCCVKSDKCSFKKTLQTSPLDAPMVDKTWTSANSWCPFHLFGAAPHTWDHHCTYLLFSQRTSDISELSGGQQQNQKSLKELLAWLELSDTVSIRCFFFFFLIALASSGMQSQREEALRLFCEATPNSPCWKHQNFWGSQSLSANHSNLRLGGIHPPSSR